MQQQQPGVLALVGQEISAPAAVPQLPQQLQAMQQRLHAIEQAQAQLAQAQAQQAQGLQGVRQELQAMRQTQAHDHLRLCRHLNGMAGNYQALMPLPFQPAPGAPNPPAFPASRAVVEALTMTQLEDLLVAYQQPVPNTQQLRLEAFKAYIGLE